jgi:hypothetical protein
MTLIFYFISYFEIISFYIVFIFLLEGLYFFEFILYLWNAFVTTTVFLSLCFIMPQFYFYYIVYRRAIYSSESADLIIDYNLEEDVIKRRETLRFKFMGPVKKKYQNPLNLRELYTDLFCNKFIDDERYNIHSKINTRVVTLNSRVRLIENGKRWRAGLMGVITTKNIILIPRIIYTNRSTSLSVKLEKNNELLTNPYNSEWYDLKLASEKVNPLLRRARPRTTVEKFVNFSLCLFFFLIFFFFYVLV